MRRLGIILLAGVLSACASQNITMNDPDKAVFDLPGYTGHDPELKARLSRIAAPIMRVSAPQCVKTRTIDFTQEPPFDICAYKVTIIYSPVLNAHTDGERIYVTSAMMDAVNDDELAFTVAHELAHILLEHKTSDTARKTRELEADAIAIPLMVRAGYSADGIADMLIRLDVGSSAPSSTHPLRADRIAVIEKALADIAKG